MLYILACGMSLWIWINNWTMSTKENYPKCGLLSNWHKPFWNELLLRIKTYRGRLCKEHHFHIANSKYKIDGHFQKKKIWTTLPFIQEDMENEFYIYRGYMYIYEYIYNYSNCTLSTLSDDSEAARRAAPMLDPSFGTLRMTCWAVSSPNISVKASCKYSLNIVYLPVYKSPSIATTVLFILISLLLLPPVMPPLPSRPIFFKMPTIPAAANRAALRVTTSHTFTMSFLTFKEASGIWNDSPIIWTNYQRTN